MVNKYQSRDQAAQALREALPGRTEAITTSEYARQYGGGYSARAVLLNDTLRITTGGPDRWRVDFAPLSMTGFECTGPTLAAALDAMLTELAQRHIILGNTLNFVRSLTK